MGASGVGQKPATLNVGDNKVKQRLGAENSLENVQVIQQMMRPQLP